MEICKQKKQTSKMTTQSKAYSITRKDQEEENLILPAPPSKQNWTIITDGLHYYLVNITRKEKQENQR